MCECWRRHSLALKGLCRILSTVWPVKKGVQKDWYFQCISSHCPVARGHIYPFSTTMNQVLSLGWCLCQFSVVATCRLPKNLLVFPQAESQSRATLLSHCTRLYCPSNIRMDNCISIVAKKYQKYKLRIFTDNSGPSFIVGRNTFILAFSPNSFY